MTIKTVHYINVDELRTLRLTCKHCGVATVVKVKTW